MLGADGAVVGVHAVVHHAIDVALQGEQLGLGLPRRIGHVVVQVAVAQVAEDHVAHAWEAGLQQGVRVVHEAGDG
ncbi:hypothetical protein D9M70_605860 [compost metagenome]